MSSPFETFREHYTRGELAYQRCSVDDAVIFYPRMCCPHCGSFDLEWRRSAGLGTVYATTTICRRDEQPYNVVIIELDEGFRMMSRVESVAAEDVAIGMRVRYVDRYREYPVFAPEGHRA